MKIRPVNIARIIAVIVTVARIYIFAPWEHALYYLKPGLDSIQEELDDATQNGLDGVIVYVQQKDQPSEIYVSGWHNRELKIPARPDALFKIASIAKLYDAAAVTKLVAAEKLALDQTLAHYMPELVGRIEYADEITLRMMVMHTSGIPNFTDQPEFNWADSSLDVLEMVLDKPALFIPNTDYSYSNTNYLLLQRIMERVLGYNTADYFNEVLLEPLGLKNTFFTVNDVAMDDLMSGYYVGHHEDFKHLDQGFVATAEDVGIFLRALNDGTLLDQKEMDIYASIYKFNHDGWVLGYTSIARYHKDIDTIVIQFVSTVGNDIELFRDIVYGRVMDIIRD